VPHWLDYPLRSLKYLLLAFFVYSIFFLMGELALKHFLDSPYNLVADIKMYYFFADISRTSLIVIGSLVVLSVVIRNFWCRYLCPYGALLGIASLLSVFKIKRNPTSCIDCGKCARVCPSAIKVDKIETVVSDECTACLGCLDACPVAATLELKMTGSRRRITPRTAAVTVVAVFAIVTGVGMFTGYWGNDVSSDTYLEHQSSVHMYGHPTSTGDVSRLNEQAEAQQQNDALLPVESDRPETAGTEKEGSHERTDR
jgi:polyferredoxin